MSPASGHLADESDVLPADPIPAGGTGGELGSRLLKGAAYSFASLVIGSGFLFALNVLIARSLGAAALGTYSLAVGVMSVAVAVGLLGLETGVLKVLPAATSTPSGARSISALLVRVIGVAVLATTLLSVGLVLAGPWMVRVLDAGEFRTFFVVVFLALPLLAVNTLGLAIYRALSWFPAEAAVNGFLNRGLRPAILALMVWAGFGIQNPSVALLVMVFVSEAVTALVLLCVLFFRLGWNPGEGGRVSDHTLGSTLRFSIPVMPAMTMQAGLQHGDLIVIGFLATVSDAGVFRAASLVALTLALVMRAFGAVFAPMISSDFAHGRIDSLRRGYRRVALLICVVSLPAFFLFVVNRVWIMGLFGEAFVEAGAIILVILASGQLINALTGQVGYMLLLGGNRNAYVWTAFLAMGLLTGLTASGYWVGGVVGAAVGSALATAVTNLVRVALVHRTMGVHPFSIHQFGAASGVLAFTAFAVALESWRQPSPWVTLGASVAVVTVVGVPLMLPVARAAREKALS